MGYQRERREPEQATAVAVVVGDPAPVRRSPRPVGLEVGAVDDPAEVEADRLADAVVGFAARGIAPAEPGIARATTEGLGTGGVVGAEGGPVGQDVDARIRARQGGGTGLAEGVRQPMEQAFGADFSGVRVHTDAESHDLNRSLGAQAFTLGSDVFFGKGAYDPGSSAGQRVLAHELAHTVQQGGAPTTGDPARRSPVKVQRLFGKKGDKKSGKADETIDDPTDAKDTTAPKDAKPKGKGKAEKVTKNFGLAKVASTAIDAAKPYDATLYGSVELYLGAYITQSQQQKIADFGGASKGDAKAEKRSLKDLVRAFVFKEFVEILFAKFVHGKGGAVGDVPDLAPEDRKAIDGKYLPKTLQVRDKWAGLLDKGPFAPETQTWLKSAGFAAAIPMDETARAKTAAGPRVDVRSTFIGGEILGAPRRMHLFIVYTSSEGDQFYLRGGPDEDDFTVADFGPYMPGTVDWDPSAPSTTVLQGAKAAEKFDALVEAASIINGLKVPYLAAEADLNSGGLGGLEAFVNGENCNSTAFTILKRAGVPTKKPSGLHPGWGHMLGDFKKQGQAMPAKEADDGEGTPVEVVGGNTQLFRDRAGVEKLVMLPDRTKLTQLRSTSITSSDDEGESDIDMVKVRLDTGAVGFVDQDDIRPAAGPVKAGRTFFVVGKANALVPFMTRDNQATFADGGHQIEVLDPSWVPGGTGLVEVRYTGIEGVKEGFIASERVTDVDPNAPIAPKLVAKVEEKAKKEEKQPVKKDEPPMVAVEVIAWFDFPGKGLGLWTAEGKQLNGTVRAEGKKIGATGRTVQAGSDLMVEWKMDDHVAWMPVVWWNMYFDDKVPYPTEKPVTVAQVPETKVDEGAKGIETDVKDDHQEEIDQAIQLLKKKGLPAKSTCDLVKKLMEGPGGKERLAKIATGLDVNVQDLVDLVSMD